MCYLDISWRTIFQWRQKQVEQILGMLQQDGLLWRCWRYLWAKTDHGSQTGWGGFQEPDPLKQHSPCSHKAYRKLSLPLRLPSWPFSLLLLPREETWLCPVKKNFPHSKPHQPLHPGHTWAEKYTHLYFNEDKWIAVWKCYVSNSLETPP